MSGDQRRETTLSPRTGAIHCIAEAIRRLLAAEIRTRLSIEDMPRWWLRGGVGPYPAAIIQPHGFSRLVAVPVGNAMLADQEPEKPSC
jgi:hypothetical protein